MIFLLEMAGTIAFAISGAVVGINKKMDIFGVAILAMTTAVGGGIIRDIILNITPPAAFRETKGGFSRTVQSRAGPFFITGGREKQDADRMAFMFPVNRAGRNCDHEKRIQQ